LVTGLLSIYLDGTGGLAVGSSLDSSVSSVKYLIIFLIIIQVTPLTPL